MLTLAKSGKKIVGIWGIVCILAISACFLFSIIQSQKAYAETKKVSGTIKFLRLAKYQTAFADCDGALDLIATHGILSSDDPDWNNARLFSVGAWWMIAKDEQWRSYGSITHPGGDQTVFVEFRDKITSTAGPDMTGESEGFFIRGTGKFGDIKARWLLKWSMKVGKGSTGEWVVEYF